MGLISCKIRAWKDVRTTLELQGIGHVGHRHEIHTAPRPEHEIIEPRGEMTAAVGFMWWVWRRGAPGRGGKFCGAFKQARPPLSLPLRPCPERERARHLGPASTDSAARPASAARGPQWLIPRAPAPVILCSRTALATEPRASAPAGGARWFFQRPLPAAHIATGVISPPPPLPSGVLLWGPLAPALAVLKKRKKRLAPRASSFSEQDTSTTPANTTNLSRAQILSNANTL
jgi:hypothetical protein